MTSTLGFLALQALLLVVAFLAVRQANVRAASRLERASDRLGDTAHAGARELDLRAASFDHRVDGVTTQMTRLADLVTALQRDAAAHHGSLTEHLEHVATTQATLAEHTGHLRDALANPKQRGQWGERMADDVLRAAGFVEDVNYRRQRAIAGGTIPDFTFVMPNDLELRMDVKFPIDNYLRVLEADNDRDREAARKGFVRDVRARIKELAVRNYADALDTVDCVLLFIPNEAVYSYLHEADRDVLDVALSQDIVLCSPSTLFAVLAVVRRSVEQFHLVRQSDEILSCLHGVIDEWGRFSAHLDLADKRLRTLTATFDDLQGVRRRQLEKSLDEVHRLSAPPADELDQPSLGHAS